MIVGVSGQVGADVELEPEECVIKIASLLRCVNISIIIVVHVGCVHFCHLFFIEIPLLSTVSGYYLW